MVVSGIYLLFPSAFFVGQIWLLQLWNSCLICILCNDAMFFGVGCHLQMCIKNCKGFTGLGSWIEIFYVVVVGVDSSCSQQRTENGSCVDGHIVLL